ncbi:MAG TPA: SDR family oxidoreductase [Solirubrobacterales bacterium]|nr:SDR family oxidoreductase [Solirubrobacterales bacterium]
MARPWETPLVHDRIAITGGGSGIGRGVAIELASLGATVYVLGRRQEPLEETAAGATDGRIVPVTCDTTDAARVDEAFAAIEADGGPVRALVHGAANVEYKRGRDITDQGFRDVVESTLVGAFTVVSRWARPLLEGGLDGIGVTLTSAMATKGTPGVAHSSAGKAGTEAMVKSLAREWGRDGIRLNAVGPGFFPVERTRAMFEPGASGAAIVDQTALGRVGELPEIVGPIVFLLTAAASYITGITLIPDGGFTLPPDVFPTYRFEGSEPGRR